MSKCTAVHHLFLACQQGTQQRHTCFAPSAMDGCVNCFRCDSSTSNQQHARQYCKACTTYSSYSVIALFGQVMQCCLLNFETLFGQLLFCTVLDLYCNVTVQSFLIVLDWWCTNWAMRFSAVHSNTAIAFLNDLKIEESQPKTLSGLCACPATNLMLNSSLTDVFLRSRSLSCTRFQDILTSVGAVRHVCTCICRWGETT